MKPLVPIKRQLKRPSVVAMALYLAGMAAIVGWSLPQRVPAEKSVAPASGMPVAAGLDAAGGPSNPAKVPGDARIRGNCVECGVVESVRTIYRADEIVSGCPVGDGQETRLPGSLFRADGRDYIPPLGDTIAEAISGNRGATKMRMTARHQFVVRFRDGSRQLFEEDAPRTLRVGERITVIAGASAADG